MKGIRIRLARLNFHSFHFYFRWFSTACLFFYVLCTKLFCSTFNEFCNRLNRSKPLIFSNLLLPMFLPKQPSWGLGPDRAIFSMCWCCDRTANRFTCTGMGTTIFVEPEPLPEFRFMPCDVSPALTRFHLARRFWNLNNERKKDVQMNIANDHIKLLYQLTIFWPDVKWHRKHFQSKKKKRKTIWNYSQLNWSTEIGRWRMENFIYLYFAQFEACGYLTPFSKA